MSWNAAQKTLRKHFVTDPGGALVTLYRRARQRLTFTRSSGIVSGIVSPQQALGRLYMTLFLRGRSARTIKVGIAPDSVYRKLALALALYALFGTFTAVALLHQKVFVISAFAHAMTFIFLGMYVATTAGEVLFNKEEGDILLHRPILPRMLLWAKVSVIVRVSLWLAGAFNIGTFFVGATAVDGSWFFLVAHALSTLLEALFTAGTVVLVYQLCLKWFGREKLDAFMTTTQVVAAILLVLSGQLVPQLMLRGDGGTLAGVNHWWIGFLPPAWYAGIDDALAGSGSVASWSLALVGAVATSVVAWLAFGQLAGQYHGSLQWASESSTSQPSHTRRNRVGALTRIPPLSWWLRDSVSRASFVLTAAYLKRDRDVKLRVYPGLAPVLVLPIVTMLQHSRSSTGSGAFGIAFAACFVSLVPLIAINTLELSQQWQASDVFRYAPMSGPGRLIDGTRKAVLLFLALPLLCIYGIIAVALGRDSSQLALLLLPGIIVLPLYAMVPCLGGHGVPFSRPTEEAKAVGRSFRMFGVMLSSAVLAGITSAIYTRSWYVYALGAEAMAVVIACAFMRKNVSEAKWGSIE